MTNILDFPEDFKLWGYSLKELRSMRDFAMAKGWTKKECDGIQTWKQSHCPGCQESPAEVARIHSAPEPERCACEHPFPHSVGYCGSVEAKIKEILGPEEGWHVRKYYIEDLEKALRALVRLARG